MPGEGMPICCLKAIIFDFDVVADTERFLYRNRMFELVLMDRI